MLWSVSGSRACNVNTGVFGGAFNCTTACMGSGRFMKYGGSSLISFTWMMTRWLSVSVWLNWWRGRKNANKLKMKF